MAFQSDTKGKLKISRRRMDQLVVSNQVVTEVKSPCCGLSVIFCGFISHLIGRETINIPEIFSGVHRGFTGKTVNPKLPTFLSHHAREVLDLHLFTIFWFNSVLRLETSAFGFSELWLRLS